MEVNEKKNKAYYLIPFTGILLKEELLQHLKNVYFADKHHPKLNQNLFILFNLKDTTEEELILWCEKSELFEDSYRYNGHLMCVFKYQNKWSEDIKLYKEGKYSKTSKIFKETILQTLFGLDNKLCSMYHILYATKEKRVELANSLLIDTIPDELWSSPDLQVEEFSISNYVEIFE